jgi:hypothetical protein
MITRERARGDHESVSSQEKKDASLIEQTFEDPNKVTFGIFECSLVVGCKDGMAEREEREKRDCV